MSYKPLETKIDELIALIREEFGENLYFEELEKAKKIIRSKNFKQYEAILCKIEDIGISLYNRRLNNFAQIHRKVQEIEKEIRDVL